MNNQNINLADCPFYLKIEKCFKLYEEYTDLFINKRGDIYSSLFYLYFEGIDFYMKDKELLENDFEKFIEWIEYDNEIKIYYNINMMNNGFKTAILVDTKETENYHQVVCKLLLHILCIYFTVNKKIQNNEEITMLDKIISKIHDTLKGYIFKLSMEKKISNKTTIILLRLLCYIEIDETASQNKNKEGITELSKIELEKNIEPICLELKLRPIEEEQQSSDMPMR